MIESRIAAIGQYLPSAELSNLQLEAEFPGWSAEKVASKIGIESRHIAGPDETALDMAEQACRNLFVHSDPQKIDYLLFCTQSPDYPLPGNATLLQHRLGLRTSIGAVDFNLGCSGYIYGLSVAKGLIAGGIARNILLVTAETYSRYLHPRDRGNRSIFGDGAAATLIIASDSPGLGEFVLGTDGAGADNLIVKNRGMRNRDAEVPDYEYANGSMTSDAFLYMNGPAIFNFTIEVVPDLIRKTLERNELTLEQVDYVVFHQANLYILNFLRKLIGIPEGKFHQGMKNTGNTVSSTIPLALSDAMEAGKIIPGKKVLLAGFGVGYSYGAVVVNF